MKNVNIKIGDKVRVTVNGVSFTGTVESVNDWGDFYHSDWYIEFRDDVDHKIRYVKEQYDRALIEVL